MPEIPGFVWLVVFGVLIALAVMSRLVRKPAQRAGGNVADEKTCKECGAAIRAKAEICPKCGVRQFAA